MGTKKSGKPKEKPKKQRNRKRGKKTTLSTLSLIGDALGIQNLDGAVVQNCDFRVTEDKAPLCLLIQEIEFHQVGSLLVIQPKKPVIKAQM